MARLSYSQGPILGGVSQQPTYLRLPNQVESQVNFVASPVEGLYRRHGTRWIAALDTGNPANTGPARVFPIVRDNDEQYVLIAQDERLRIFDLEGTEYGIYSPLGVDPDWSYLTGTAPSDLKVLNVADYTFVLNTTRAPSMANTPVDEVSTTVMDAFVSVIQGQYSTNYSVTLSPNSSAYPPETYVVRTFDGDGPADEQRSRYKIAFKSGEVGNGGDLWEFQYTDADAATQTVSATVLNSANKAKDLAEDLRNAFNLEDGLTASAVQSTGWTSVWYYFYVTADAPELTLGSPWDLGVTNSTIPATATPPDIDEVQEAQVQEIGSLSTRDISEKLAQKINELSALYSAEAFDHVIRITGPLATALTADDTYSGQLLYVCNRAVNEFTELPTLCQHEYGALVRGSKGGREDDYWVRFRRETTTGLEIDSVGPGTWEEGLPVYPLGTPVSSSEFYKRSFLKANMPWQLVRKVDGGGSVYFSWQESEWNDRDVGDGEMNPFPSFVGETISDIVFHRNRLGLVAGGNVVFSESGVYTNFWRTSIRDLLDSDPVDLRANIRDVIRFNHALQLDESLLLLSDRVQCTLEAEPVLSPTTATLRTLFRLDTDPVNRPFVVGRGAFLPYRRGSFSGINEIIRVDDVNYDYADISEQIPSYLDGGIVDIATSPVDGQVVLLTDTAEVYLYSYFVRGREKLQSAWSSLSFNGEVLGLAFIGSTLAITIRDGPQVNLYTIPFSRRDTDEPSLSWSPHLDRRLAYPTGAGVYDPDLNTTTVTLPYYCDNANPGEWLFVNASTGDGAVAVPDFSDISLPTVTAPGDWSGVSFYIGTTFESSVGFSQIILRATVGERLEGVQAGKTVVLSGLASFRDTGYARLSVTDGLSQDVYDYSPGSPPNAPVVDTDTFEFGVYGDNREVQVALSSSSYLPLSLTGLEWTVELSLRNTRYRG